MEPGDSNEAVSTESLKGSAANVAASLMTTSDDGSSGDLIPPVADPAAPPAPAPSAATPPADPATPPPPAAAPAATPPPAAAAPPNNDPNAGFLSDPAAPPAPTDPATPPPPAGPDMVALEAEIDGIDENRIPQAQKANFKSMRTLMANYKARVAELESGRAEFMNEDGTPKAGFGDEALREQLEESFNQIARLDLTQDPRFVKKYKDKLGVLAATAAAVIKDFDGDETILQQAAGMSLRARQQFLQEQVPEATPHLIPIFSQIDSVQQERAIEINNYQETKVALDEQSLTIQGEHDQKVTAQRKSNAIALMQTQEFNVNGNSLFDPVAGDEKWNGAVANLRTEIDQAFSTNDPQAHANALVLSRLAPVFKMLYDVEKTRADDLQNQINLAAGARPRVNGAAPPAPGATPPVPASMTAEEASKISSERLAGVFRG